MSTEPKILQYNQILDGIVNKLEIFSIDRNTVFKFTSSDFIEIIQTTAFIDKTLMIKEVFRNEKIKGTVITAPHKFGKSTNLTMLKYFLEIQVDSLGNPLTQAKAKQPITDTSNYHVFKGLKIGKETQIMKNHFGKYPVLYVDFVMKNCVKSYNSIYNECAESVHKSFKLHEYLINSTKLDYNHKNICKVWCHITNYKNFDFFQVITGLQLLCYCLYKHFNKPCFVLIDNLDSIFLTDTITEPLNSLYQSILFFMRFVLSILDSDQLVVRAFLTGKSVYHIHSIIPLCIQIQPFSECHEFTDYFGLTIDELEYLFNKPEFKTLKTRIADVKYFYGAYYKIDRDAKIKRVIYCIWSVLKVLFHDRTDNFWRDFGSIFLNLSNKWIEKKIKQIIGKEKQFMITLYDITREKHDAPPPILDNQSKKSSDYFFNHLLDLGYITCDPRSIYLIGFQTIKNCSVVYIKVPNEEVKQDIENKLSLLC